MILVLESCLSSLPFCFIHFCLSPSLQGGRSPGITKQRQRIKQGVGGGARNICELASLFLENECHFQSFPLEAGPRKQQQLRCCRGE